MLKTYIKSILANDFITFFKSFTDVFTLFVKKLDRNFCLYIYCYFNKLTIKN